MNITKLFLFICSITTINSSYHSNIIKFSLLKNKFKAISIQSKTPNILPLPLYKLNQKNNDIENPNIIMVSITNFNQKLTYKINNIKKKFIDFFVKPLLLPLQCKTPDILTIPVVNKKITLNNFTKKSIDFLLNKMIPMTVPIAYLYIMFYIWYGIV